VRARAYSCAQDELIKLFEQRQRQQTEQGMAVKSGWAKEREQQRAFRRKAVVRSNAPPRANDPFTGLIPPYQEPAPPPAAAPPPADDKGKGGKGAKGAKGKAGAAPAKKQSTKLLSLQHQRPGEKPKGVKGWIKELDARGWSKKKTALSAGLEAWFEAYAEAYAGKRLAKQIQPFVHTLHCKILQEACQWWWTYARALASKGGISAGAAGRLAKMERASMMLRSWHRLAKFRKELPSHLVNMPYGRLLRHALREWQKNLLDSTPRRKAALRKLLAQAAEHWRLRGALPNAWLSWCASA
jgi:hypothetical protein